MPLCFGVEIKWRNVVFIYSASFKNSYTLINIHKIFILNRQTGGMKQSVLQMFV